jgi:hypothetical protein
MNHHARWKKYYDALVQYEQRFGDAMPPISHVEFCSSGEEVNLGNWVSYMRTRYRQNALSEDRIALLEKLPTWKWGPVRPGPKSHDYVVLRNASIVNDHDSGMSLAQIAREHNLSRQRIHQIVRSNNG